MARRYVDPRSKAGLVVTARTELSASPLSFSKENFGGYDFEEKADLCALPLPEKSIIFVTNNATKSRRTYKSKFDHLGVQAEVVSMPSLAPIFRTDRRSDIGLGS